MAPTKLWMVQTALQSRLGMEHIKLAVTEVQQGALFKPGGWTSPYRHNILYLLTPCSTVLLEKPTGFQLVKKFPAFYGTLRFITAFKSDRHLSLSWATPPTSNFLKIHLNTILPSTPASPKWSLSTVIVHRFPKYVSTQASDFDGCTAGSIKSGRMLVQGRLRTWGIWEMRTEF